MSDPPPRESDQRQGQDNEDRHLVPLKGPVVASRLVRQQVTKVKTSNAGVDGVYKRWARGGVPRQTVLMKGKFVRTRANANESERPGRPMAYGREDSIASGPDSTVLTNCLARAIKGLLRNNPIIGIRSRTTRSAR